MDGETVMEFVAAPVLHENRTPPLAVSVALAPLQIEIAAGKIEATGSGLTFTVREAEAVQPLSSVTVTEYEVLDEGDTVTKFPVAPVLHEYNAPPLAVSVALPPRQMLTVAGEITGTGTELMFTVRDASAVQPLTSLTVTE